MTEDAFDSWLSLRLKELEADEVFCPYIRSILDGDESSDDKETSLEDMLEGLGLENVKEFKDQIWSKWTSSQSNGEADDKVVDGAVGGGVDLSAAFASITDTRTKEYAAAKAKTASKGGISADKDVKAAIMAQYAQVAEDDSDDEEEDDDEDLGEGRNANKEAVAQAELEKREAGKAQSAAKKEKDKEDREKQKKLAEERKKKAQEKSAKVERKR